MIDVARVLGGVEKSAVRREGRWRKASCTALAYNVEDILLEFVSSHRANVVAASIGEHSDVVVTVVLDRGRGDGEFNEAVDDNVGVPVVDLGEFDGCLDMDEPDVGLAAGVVVPFPVSVPEGFKDLRVIVEGGLLGQTAIRGVVRLDRPGVRIKEVIIVGLLQGSDGVIADVCIPHNETGLAEFDLRSKAGFVESADGEVVDDRSFSLGFSPSKWFGQVDLVGADAFLDELAVGDARESLGDVVGGEVGHGGGSACLSDGDRLSKATAFCFLVPSHQGVRLEKGDLFADGSVAQERGLAGGSATQWEGERESG